MLLQTNGHDEVARPIELLPRWEQSPQDIGRAGMAHKQLPLGPAGPRSAQSEPTGSVDPVPGAVPR